MIIEAPVSLRTRLEILDRAHTVVQDLLWSSYTDVNVEASKTTFYWAKLKDDHIDRIASLLTRTEQMSVATRSFGAYIIENLRLETRGVFACVERNSLGQLGLCALCCIQDQPTWEAVSGVFDSLASTALDLMKIYDRHSSRQSL